MAIDLQHFKLFNEWYGRGLGDHVLADIGRELVATAEARRGVSGYIGGDDFALLVPAEQFSVDGLYQKLHDIIKAHGVSIGFLPALGACCSNGSTSIYIALKCVESRQNASRKFRMVGAGGEELHLVVDADYVDDPMSDVKCILSMRRENGN